MSPTDFREQQRDMRQATRIDGHDDPTRPAVGCHGERRATPNISMDGGLAHGDSGKGLLAGSLAGKHNRMQFLLRDV